MISLPSWSRRVGPLGPDPVDSGRAAELMSRVIWAGPGAGACADAQVCPLGLLCIVWPNQKRNVAGRVGKLSHQS